MSEPEIYHVESGILPQALISRLRSPLKNVDLTEPFLSPFVEESLLEIGATVIYDNIWNFYKKAVIGWKPPMSWYEGIGIPDASLIDLTTQRERDFVESSYGIKIGSDSVIGVDLSKKTKDFEFWILAHEFLHIVFGKLSRGRIENIMATAPEDLANTEIEGMFGLHYTYGLFSREGETERKKSLLNEMLSFYFTSPKVFASSACQAYFNDHPRFKRALIEAGYKLDPSVNLDDLTSAELRRLRESSLFRISESEKEFLRGLNRVLHQRKTKRRRQESNLGTPKGID